MSTQRKVALITGASNTISSDEAYVNIEVEREMQWNGRPGVILFIFCPKRNGRATRSGRLTATSHGGPTKCRQPQRNAVDAAASVT
jgi:hypothetical protein